MSHHTKRAIVTILEKLAHDRGDQCDILSGGWIVRFTRKGLSRHLYGFNLEINSAAAHLLACDKSASAEILASLKIPHVPHRLFLHPRMGPYAPPQGHWREAAELFELWKNDVVVKDCNGTGGVGVYRATTFRALEAAFLRLFQRVHAVSVSPFLDILSETRFVLLDGTCQLAFEKHRPTVTGDGHQTLAALATHANLDFDPETSADAEEILPAGAKRLLSWKHNLGRGAHAQLVEWKSHLALSLATAAASALNLRFGSVDIILTSRGYEVLEVNAGVMMESVTRQLKDGERLATAIYERAYDQMMNQDHT